MKGDKKKYVNEALTALGSAATLNKAQDWLRRQYGVSIILSDSHFYRERRSFQEKQEDQRRKFEEQSRREQEQSRQAQARQEEQARQTQARQEQIRQEEQRQAAAQEAERLRLEIQNMTPAQEVATRMLSEGEIPPTESKMSGVSILIKAAKVLVTRLGKEEAKQLIDVL